MSDCLKCTLQVHLRHSAGCLNDTCCFRRKDLLPSLSHTQLVETPLCDLTFDTLMLTPERCSKHRQCVHKKVWCVDCTYTHIYTPLHIYQCSALCALCVCVCVTPKSK